MASFNQAVDIPEPQDTIMVVKMKHSARGLADATQVDREKLFDKKIKEMIERINNHFDKIKAELCIE